MKGSHSLPRLGHHPEHEHPLDAAELGDENPTGTMKAMLGFVTLIPTYVLDITLYFAIAFITYITMQRHPPTVGGVRDVADHSPC